MFLASCAGPVCGIDVTLRTPSNQQLPTQSTGSSNVAASQTAYEECKVVGENNNAKQFNGNLGDYVVGTQKYTRNTVTGNGTQFNGSASGQQGMEIAKNFFAEFGGSVLNSKT